MANLTIQDILQEPAVAYTTTGSRIDLITLSRKGIKKQALLNLASLLDLNLNEMANLLPVTTRTLQRRDDSSRLSASVSEHVILLAELTEKGADVLDNIKKFKKWLREESTALGGHKPLNLLDTAVGIQLVSEELGKLEYGVYS